jgi:ribosomal protein L40E
MKYFLAPLSILAIITISNIAVPSSAYPRTGFFRPAENLKDAGLRQGAPTNKTWLILIGTMAGFALMFLLVLEIGGGGLLPYKIEDLAAKFCVGVIATALCLYAYYMTQRVIFIILIPFAIMAIIFVYLKRAIKKVYMRKLGRPSDSSVWICRRCGTENSVIIKECHRCYSPRIEPARGPVKGEWLCGNCKNKNSLDDKSCRYCGAQRDEKA